MLLLQHSSFSHRLWNRRKVGLLEVIESHVFCIPLRHLLHDLVHLLLRNHQLQPSAQELPEPTGIVLKIYGFLIDEDVWKNCDLFRSLLAFYDLPMEKIFTYMALRYSQDLIIQEWFCSRKGKRDKLELLMVTNSQVFYYYFMCPFCWLATKHYLCYAISLSLLILSNQEMKGFSISPFGHNLFCRSGRKISLQLRYHFWEGKLVHN